MPHRRTAVAACSSLRALGFTDPRTAPWDGPTQALLGIALGIVAVRRGRWPAVLLLAVAARIALDPGTNRYYVAGAIVGAVVWDLASSQLRFPWWTAGAPVSLFFSRWIPMTPAVHGWITLGDCVACTALLVRDRQLTRKGDGVDRCPG